MKNNSLNCAYRLVWNDAAQCYQAAPETARGRGKSGRSARVLALACASLFGAVAWAGPTGGTVSAGSGSISQQGSQTTITQTSQHLAINWAGFSIGAQERVNFVQPGSGAIALNRVTGSEVSVINGALNANGQVWILNSNGLLFGKTASVNVGGLVASTLSLSDADFMAGKSRFTADGSQGRVVNQGSLSGGYVALLGQQVSNSGTIKTPGGTSALAAGDAITLSFSGNRLLSVQVDAGTYKALAENSGLIQADDGTVLMSSTAKDALLDTVVNNTGIIEARGISTNGGRIELMGGFNGGTVKVGGTLDASSTTHDGGFIETSGAHVLIGEGARISTLSAGGKTGTWLVDPTDFTISAGGDAGTTSGIGASTLATQLASNNVTLATDASGSDVGNINVNAAVSWSANTTLTLNAYNNININAALTATGASAGLVLNYGDYATAGSARTGTNYNIAAPVTLSGASASLSVNNLAYTLVRSMSQLDTLDNASGRYALAQDLDASGTTYSAAVIGGNFRGTFAGLGHTISDLTISAGSDMYVGLFSLSSGSIRDLGLSSASVSGGAYVGGLVGQSTGSISNVYATGSVSGSSNVGGLVGSASAGSISNAYATGSVTGTTFVGGLVGANVGSISNVYATSSVTGNGPVGGLAGTNSGSISNAYATGRVTGANVVNAGGLVGSNTGASSSISNAYWDSASTGRIKDIGIRLAGTFTNLSAVTSSTAYNHSSYANLGTWTETVSGSGVWVAANGSGVKQWVMIEGATRPFLYSEYSTSVGNAHQLQLMAYDPSASYTLSRNIDASETVGSNASGLWTSSGFSPVGNSSAQFSGSLDGAGHTINQLSIDRSNGLYVGLFGFGNGSISDLGLVGGSVSGGNYVGGLIGYSSGSLSKVYNTGSVMGNGWFVGGLVGSNDGSVSNAYTTGNVSNVWQYTGGLVGYNNNTASIRDAYATGDVTGSGSNGGYVGGLVGYNVGSISNTFASGRVLGTGSEVGGLIGYNRGSIAASFWLSSASGTGVGVGVEEDVVNNRPRGLSDSEAKTASTYTDAGWDIASQGGSSAIWRIYDGDSAPLLRSFLTPLTATLQNVSKVYDGSTSVSGATYTLSDANADRSLMLGSLRTSSKNAGSYTLDGLGLYSTQQGYDLSFINATATISAATLSVAGTTTAANKTYDGTTVATLSGASLSGTVYGSDAVTLTQTGSFDSKSVGNGKTVSYTSALSGADAGNYVLASSSGSTTATISAATLSVTGTATAANKTYDGTTAATLSGASLSGTVYGSDAVTLTQTGSFDSKNVGAGKTVSYISALTGADAGNYVLTGSTSGTATASITAATLSIAGTTTAANKTYDGTTVAMLSGASLSGTVYGSDAVTLTQTGSFDSKNVGTGKTVSYISALTGADAGNYVLASSSSTTTASITAATLSVTGTTMAANKTYDGTTAATLSGASLGGTVYGSDAVTLTQTGSFDSKNVGIGKTVSYTGALTGADAGNYVLASSSGATTASIAAATLSVTGTTTAANKTYDGTTAATLSGASLGGTVYGSDVVTLTQTGGFDSKNAGTGKTVSYTSALTGADAGNYVLASSSGTTTASIAAATLSVTGTTTAANKTYDGTTAATLSGASLGGTVYGSDVVTLTQTGGFDSKNAGTGKTVSYSSALTGADAGNYVLASSSGTTTASIAAATLSVTGTATAANKTYDGSTIATLSGASLSGTVYGSDAVTLTQTGSFDTKNVGTGKTVSYTSTLSGADAGNYLLASSSGTATASITAATLSVTGTTTAANKTYDGTTAATLSGASLGGTVYGSDAVTLTQTGNFDNKNAGSGKTVSFTSALVGADAGNYVLSNAAGSTTASITPKALTAAFVVADKTYDGTTAATTLGSLLGLIAGDAVSLATAGSFADKNAGSAKTVKVSASLSGADAGNYTLQSDATTTASITPAALTVQAADDSRSVTGQPYRGGNGVSYSGLVDGETAAVLGGSLVYGGSSQGAVTAGSYDISVSGLSSTNYSIRYLDGSLLITGASATDVSQAQRVAVQQISPPESGGAQTAGTGKAPTRYVRPPDGGLQSSDGNRLLRVANGGLALPTN